MAVVKVKGHSTLGGIQAEGNYLANLASGGELDNHNQTLIEVHGVVLMDILLHLPGCYICSLKMRMVFDHGARGEVMKEIRKQGLKSGLKSENKVFIRKQDVWSPYLLIDNQLNDCDSRQANTRKCA